MIQKNTTIETFDGLDFSKYRMPLITIYHSPQDFEGKYVARLFDVDQPTEYSVVRDTLEDLRAALPIGFVPFQRSEDDDPVIVEVWI